MNETVEHKKSLDEVLLAMDVVDTLRHREQTLLRELDESGREAELVERLREIYKAQGIDVPDHVIEEGVKALKDKRFSYSPPESSISVKLAKLYISRDRWGRPFFGAVAAIAMGLSIYQFGVVGPAQARANAERVELAETIPGQISVIGKQIADLATQDRALALSATHAADARRALVSGNKEEALVALGKLEQLRDELSTTYEVRVVYGPTEPRSGVFRLNDDAPGNSNYYLIVEAIDPAGRRVERAVTNQETNVTRRTSRWGQEVSEADFNRIAADKRDDLIIQDAVIGQKLVGQIDPVFTVDTTGGAILEW